MRNRRRKGGGKKARADRTSSLWREKRRKVQSLNKGSLLGREGGQGTYEGSTSKKRESSVSSKVEWHLRRSVPKRRGLKLWGEPHLRKAVTKRKTKTLAKRERQIRENSEVTGRFKIAQIINTILRGSWERTDIFVRWDLKLRR